MSTFVAPPVDAGGRGPLAVLGDLLRRRGGRRALSVLSTVLAIAGVAIFAYPFFTDLYTSQLQHRLRSHFDDPAIALSYRTHSFRIGEGFTRLVIPSIHLDVLVVEGTTPAALKAGAGHYIGTPLPGEAGNVAIAGHRTTFGHPFNQLDQIAPGDKVELFTPTTEFVYTAVGSFDGAANPHPVLPTNTAVVSQPADPRVHELTLTTCHPKGSAAMRLVLRATLSAALPLTKPVKH